MFGRLRASDDYSVIVTARAAAEMPAALVARSYIISSCQLPAARSQFSVLSSQ